MESRNTTAMGALLTPNEEFWPPLSVVRRCLNRTGMLGKCRITRNARRRRIPNRPHLGYREARAVVVVEGATV